MIIFYRYDSRGVFFGSVEIDPLSAIPKNTTQQAPPETSGDEFAWWDGAEWEVLTEIPAVPLETRRAELLDHAKKEKTKAFYSNVTIPFPTDDKEIHFRNETDRANIGDKILKAFMQVTAGNGASSIKFTPVSGGEVSMTCLQLLTAFTGLAEGKDQLFYDYNDVIADVKAASDTEELDAAETALNDL